MCLSLFHTHSQQPNIALLISQNPKANFIQEQHFYHQTLKFKQKNNVFTLNPVLSLPGGGVNNGHRLPRNSLPPFPLRVVLVHISINDLCKHPSPSHCQQTSKETEASKTRESNGGGEELAWVWIGFFIGGR